MVKDVPLEMEDLTVPNGTTVVSVEELVTLSSVDSVDEHHAATPSNHSNSEDSESDRSSHHDIHDPEHRESTFSNGIDKTDPKKASFKTRQSDHENDSDHFDEDYRSRRSVVGQLPTHFGNGIMNPRPSRRASFAMQMLLPMQGLQNTQGLGKSGSTSRRCSAAQNQPSSHQHVQPTLESSGPTLRGGTRHMSILSPNPNPRQRARSSSFALNSTAAITGFQAQLQQLQAAEDKGRKKSLMRSRTSVVGLDHLIKQVTEKKDDANAMKAIPSGDETSVHDNGSEPPSPTPGVEPPSKFLMKTATFNIHEEHDANSATSESDSSTGSDESEEGDETHEDDTGEEKKKTPLGRRFTRMLPAGDHNLKKAFSYEGGTPWIFSNQADMIFGCLIVMNAAFLGVETDYGSKLHDYFWLAIELLFVMAFTTELFLRIKNHREVPQELDDESGPFWKNAWNVIDFIIVVVGIVDTVIITLFVQEILGNKVNEGGGKLSMVTMVRLFRILRLLRVLRIFRFLRELLLLAQGIFVAIKALIFPMMLVFLVLYTCSIITTKLIGEQVDSSDVEARELADWFGSVPKSMFTLFQLMTLEEWSNVARLSGSKIGSWSQFLLFTFVSFTNLVLLNLVAGVILENVLAISKREEEKALQKEEGHRMNTVLKIHNLFDAVLGDRDTDELTIEEFRSACCNPRVVRQLQSLQIATYEAEELFILMDTAKRGAINIDHFIEGCLRIRGAARAKHLLGVQFDVQKVWSKLSDQLDEVEDRLVLESQRNVTEGIDMMQDYIQEIMPEIVKEAVTECLVDGAEDRLVDAVKDAVSDMLQELAKSGSGISASLLVKTPQVSDTASSSSQAWVRKPDAQRKDAAASHESQDLDIQSAESLTSSHHRGSEVNQASGSLLVKDKSLLLEELHKLDESHEEHEEHSEFGEYELQESEGKEPQEDSEDEAYCDPTALWSGDRERQSSESATVVPVFESRGSDVTAEATSIVTNLQQADKNQDSDPSNKRGSKKRKKSEKTAKEGRSSQKEKEASSPKELRRSQVAHPKLKDVASRMEALHREEDGLLRRLATCKENRTAEVSLLTRLLSAEESQDDQSDVVGKRSIALSHRKDWLGNKRSTAKGSDEGESSANIAAVRHSSKKLRASKSNENLEIENDEDSNAMAVRAIASERPTTRGTTRTSVRGSITTITGQLDDRSLSVKKRNSSQFFGGVLNSKPDNMRTSAKVKSWND